MTSRGGGVELNPGLGSWLNQRVIPKPTHAANVQLDDQLDPANGVGVKWWDHSFPTSFPNQQKVGFRRTQLGMLVSSE